MSYRLIKIDDLTYQDERRALTPQKHVLVQKYIQMVKKHFPESAQTR